MAKDERLIIFGKTLVITDLHIGLKKANQSRLTIIADVFKEFLKTIKKEKIDNVICCGDIFHSRVSLDLQALNVGLKLIDALAKKCKCYLILGNHDLYYKNNVAINSTNVFKQMKNVLVIDKPTEVVLNKQSALFVPWLSDLSGFKKESYDLMFGHFDIDGKFLIASYIEQHSGEKKTSEILNELIERDSLLNETTGTTDLKTEIENLQKSKVKAGNLVGDFVEYAKQFGVIYAGHIHQHDEFIARSRQFIFVGSPYQQNFGEIDSNCGYYVLDENNKRKFYPITSVPKHVRLKISEILEKGIDEFDFSVVKGNFVQKIYDVDVDMVSETKINQKIVDYGPYEEALPEYSIAAKVDNTIVTNESLEMIKKSKLDYIKNYIENIEEKVLEENKIERGNLYKILESYYVKASENL